MRAPSQGPRRTRRPAPEVTWSHPRRPAPATAPVLLGLAAIAVGLIVGLMVLSGNDGSGGGTDRADRSARDPRNATQRSRSERATDRGVQPERAPAPAEPQQSDASPAQLNDQGFAS